MVFCKWNRLRPLSVSSPDNKLRDGNGQVIFGRKWKLCRVGRGEGGDGLHFARCPCPLLWKWSPMFYNFVVFTPPLVVVTLVWLVKYLLPFINKFSRYCCTTRGYLYGARFWTRRCISVSKMMSHPCRRLPRCLTTHIVTSWHVLDSLFGLMLKIEMNSSPCPVTISRLENCAANVFVNVRFQLIVSVRIFHRKFAQSITDIWMYLVCRFEYVSCQLIYYINHI